MDKLPKLSRKQLRDEWKAKKAAKDRNSPASATIAQVESSTPASLPATLPGNEPDIPSQPTKASSKSKNQKTVPKLTNETASSNDNDNNNREATSNLVGGVPTIAEQEKVNNSMTKLQASIRRFITLRRFTSVWQNALQEADEYWLQLYWEKEEERRRKLLAERARKQVMSKYLYELSYSYFIKMI